MKEFAIREIDKDITMDPVRKIILYRKFGVEPKILIRSYAAFCVRGAPLSIEEGNDLSMDIVIPLVIARERARADPAFGHLFATPTNVGDELNGLISDVFRSTSSSASNNGSVQQSGGLVNSTITLYSNSLMVLSRSLRPLQKAIRPRGREESMRAQVRMTGSM
jgi:hypothetical protein